MAIEASRWVTYGEAAALLGLSNEATKRLSLRQGWPRRVDSAGGALVAVPDGLDAGPPASDDVDAGQGGARSLLDFLEMHVERLTDELAEVRTEMRGVRYEAESLRIEAGRAQVLAALVEAERARSAEIRAERDRIAAELAERRRLWPVRVLGAFLDCRRPSRRRAF